ADQAGVIGAGLVLVSLLSRQVTPPAHPGIWILVPLALLAVQFPLHLEPNDRLDTTAGVYFCLLLLVSAPDAVVIVALTNAVAHSLSALRLLRRARVKPPLSV